MSSQMIAMSAQKCATVCIAVQGYAGVGRAIVCNPVKFCAIL
jgi:hypothetical protein